MSGQAKTINFHRIRNGLAWRSQVFLGRAKHILALCKGYWALLLTGIYRLFPPKSHPHKLDRQVIISLTSYPPRFKTLPLTLASLCAQKIRPDRIILWIEKTDEGQLPQSVKDFASRGVEIRLYENPKGQDIGPYRKIIPALETFPDACIVTADDDCYYDPHWLETLLREWNGTKEMLVAHRTHLPTTDEQGNLSPYFQWSLQIEGPKEDKRLFVTGCGGVLYPPGSLHPDVLDQDLFMTLCPRADDLWLNWMAWRQGCLIRKTNYKSGVTNWPSSQDVNLFNENYTQGDNDRKIQALIEHFGWPLTQNEPSNTKT